MKSIMFLLCLLSLSLGAFATTKTEVGHALGKALLGDQFKEGQSVETVLNGLKDCQIEIKITAKLGKENKPRVRAFEIIGRKNDKSILIQPFKPTSITQDDKNGLSKVEFTSEGPCLGGIFWGPSCDKNTNTVIVKRDADGNIKSIELKTEVDLLINKKESLKCEF